MSEPNDCIYTQEDMDDAVAAVKAEVDALLAKAARDAFHAGAVAMREKVLEFCQLGDHYIHQSEVVELAIPQQPEAAPNCIQLNNDPVRYRVGEAPTLGTCMACGGWDNHEMNGKTPHVEVPRCINWKPEAPKDIK